MHVIQIELAPEGTDPEEHDRDVREAIIAACEEHGEVELHYPNGSPDLARVVDGALVVTSAPPR